MVTLYGYKRVLKDALPTPEWKQMLWKDGIGAIDEHLNGFQQWGLPPSDNENVWPASRHAWALNEIQRFFVEDTRLGIPVDFTNEASVAWKVIKPPIPHQLGLGHTWNRELIRQVGLITGREARMLGYTNVYAPILDIVATSVGDAMRKSTANPPILLPSWVSKWYADCNIITK